MLKAINFKILHDFYGCQKHTDNRHDILNCKTRATWYWVVTSTATRQTEPQIRKKMIIKMTAKFREHVWRLIGPHSLKYILSVICKDWKKNFSITSVNSKENFTIPRISLVGYSHLIIMSLVHISKLNFLQDGSSFHLTFSPPFSYIYFFFLIFFRFTLASCSLVSFQATL